MHHMQGKRDKLERPADFDLEVLSKRLSLTGMPAQAVIANEAGVSQSTVSRAIQGSIRTGSRGAIALWKYAEARAAILDRPDTQVGGSKARPVEQKPGRKRKNRVARLRSATSSEETPLSRKHLEAAAYKGLRDYLSDAFDPRLVIEQLAVLRRAQDRGRSDTKT